MPRRRQATEEGPARPDPDPPRRSAVVRPVGSDTGGVGGDRSRSQSRWLIHTDTWAGSRAWCTTLARSSRNRVQVNRVLQAGCERGSARKPLQLGHRKGLASRRGPKARFPGTSARCQCLRRRASVGCSIRCHSGAPPGPAGPSAADVSGARKCHDTQPITQGSRYCRSKSASTSWPRSLSDGSAFSPMARSSSCRSTMLWTARTPVFRTAHGSKLSAAEGHDLVAFEADGYDERANSGWSVLVNGRAQAIYDEAEIQRLNRLSLRPWVTAVERPFWIRIRPTSVTGRQTPGAS